MEARVDETMSACDMNVLLQETNFVALVESTAKRVDQFEQRFEQRISVLENGSLQRVEDRLQEVHELAKGAYNTQQHTASGTHRLSPCDSSALFSSNCTPAQRTAGFACQELRLTLSTQLTRRSLRSNASRKLTPRHSALSRPRY